MIILIEINPSINIMRIMLDFLLTNIQIFSLRNLANKKTRESGHVAGLSWPADWSRKGHFVESPST
jgi:hypothetical protein